METTRKAIQEKKNGFRKCKKKFKKFKKYKLEKNSLIQMSGKV